MGKQMHTTGKTTQERAQETRYIKVKGKPVWKLAQGPQVHHKGGVHQDKRNKRTRTRGAALRKALRDQN